MDTNKDGKVSKKEYKDQVVCKYGDYMLTVVKNLGLKFPLDKKEWLQICV